MPSAPLATCETDSLETLEVSLQDASRRRSKTPCRRRLRTDPVSPGNCQGVTTIGGPCRDQAGTRPLGGGHHGGHQHGLSELRPACPRRYVSGFERRHSGPWRDRSLATLTSKNVVISTAVEVVVVEVMEVMGLEPTTFHVADGPRGNLLSCENARRPASACAFTCRRMTLVDASCRSCVVGLRARSKLRNGESRAKACRSNTTFCPMCNRFD